MKEAGVKVIGNVTEFEYSKFAHVMDPEGNKIELWEPIDNSFDDMYDEKGDMNRE